MSSPMKYIKDLESAGFQRNQAEAQVEMVLDAIEGGLVTKTDFAVFKSQLDNRFSEIDNRFTELRLQMKELELRLTTHMGLMFVASTTLIVSVLTLVIKS